MVAVAAGHNLFAFEAVATPARKVCSCKVVPRRAVLASDYEGAATILRVTGSDRDVSGPPAIRASGLLGGLDAARGA